MKYKTCELNGGLLDTAVAKAAGVTLECDGPPELWAPLIYEGKSYHEWSPSTNWAQGGPIIQREGISVIFLAQPVMGGLWMATPNKHHIPHFNRRSGSSPLMAAMRCYVAYKLGVEVEL